MTTTEFLFGHPKEKYGEELERIAHERIEDGKTLLAMLYDKVSYDPREQDEVQEQLAHRIGEVQDAIHTWRKILEVEE